jgi:hypothetical protein
MDAPKRQKYALFIAQILYNRMFCTPVVQNTIAQKNNHIFRFLAKIGLAITIIPP